ncbi:MAG TPA: DUF3387 domain-containing protein, partial [Desulfobacterales bacterium]|nr:DUF3387 domain-containing protein [Desulfobacterales bacterium]
EVMCREVFKKFKACINTKSVNTYRAEYGAINIVYKSLQQDRDRADITDIIQQLQQVVDEAIVTQANMVAEEQAPYDISKIDFERLRKEFERSPAKRTTVQNLKQAIESKLQRLLERNPLRTDFQRHYEEIVAEYNREKDRITIEKTFEALLKLVQALDEEERRAIREGLDEESLALFDLLRKPDLSTADIKRVKKVAVELLETLKAEKLKIDHWRDKETTRDAVRITIRDFLWSDKTGLPVDSYSEEEVVAKAEDVFLHVFRAYPTVPSPFYAEAI